MSQLFSALNASLPSPVSRLEHPLLEAKKINLWIKRDDLIHPALTGNKYRKSLVYFKQAIAGQYRTLTSFGGQYSNHLLALAAMGCDTGIATVGCIRGAVDLARFPVLRQCHDYGMQLVSLYPSAYYPEQQQMSSRLATALQHFEPYLVVPEGGTSVDCLEDVAQIMVELVTQLGEFDNVICPVGTGGTVAGLLSGLAQTGHPGSVLGMLAVKGYQQLPAQGLQALQQYCTRNNPVFSLQNRLVLENASYGGFARTTPQLLARIHALQQTLHIPLDYVYSGKAMLRLFELIDQDYFNPGTRLVFLHTGGWQTSPVNDIYSDISKTG